MNNFVSDTRPVVRLKQVQFSEKDVDEVVCHAGGKRISEMVFPIPEGVENCDYLIGDHLVELKIIELEPLEIQERQEKLAHLFAELVREGKTNVTPSGQIHLHGEASLRYWRIVGTPVRRRLEKVASQIKDTKILLNRPNLRGAAFLIKRGADSIDSTSFWHLASRHRRDFSSEINVVMCFSEIPGVVEKANRPCVTFDHAPSGDEGDDADEAFVELFKTSFHAMFANKLGKTPDEIISNDAIIQPLRAPFEINTPKGKIAIN